MPYQRRHITPERRRVLNALRLALAATRGKSNDEFFAAIQAMQLYFDMIPLLPDDAVPESRVTDRLHTNPRPSKSGSREYTPMRTQAQLADVYARATEALRRGWPANRVMKYYRLDSPRVRYLRERAGITAYARGGSPSGVRHTTRGDMP